MNPQEALKQTQDMERKERESRMLLEEEADWVKAENTIIVLLGIEPRKYSRDVPSALELIEFLRVKSIYIDILPTGGGYAARLRRHPDKIIMNDLTLPRAVCAVVWRILPEIVKSVTKSES